MTQYNQQIMRAGQQAQLRHYTVDLGIKYNTIQYNTI